MFLDTATKTALPRADLVSKSALSRFLNDTVLLRFQGMWEPHPHSRLGQDSAHEDA